MQADAEKSGSNMRKPVSTKKKKEKKKEKDRRLDGAGPKGPATVSLDDAREATKSQALLEQAVISRLQDQKRGYAVLMEVDGRVIRDINGRCVSGELSLERAADEVIAHVSDDNLQIIMSGKG